MKKKIITTLSIIVILCTLFFSWFYLSKAHIIPNYFEFNYFEEVENFPFLTERFSFYEELSCKTQGKVMIKKDKRCGGLSCTYLECITKEELKDIKQQEKERKEYCKKYSYRDFQKNPGTQEAKEYTKKCRPLEPMKPVIYLYPPVEQEIQVRLQYQGEIFAHYPDYDEKIEGWKVIAKPDGTLMNLSDNKEYSYLFWEGKPETPVDYDLSKGFVVKGSDTKAFLQQKLAEIGLTPKEYNEFIVYWFPKMQDNPYNLIHFAQEQYTDTAPLSTIPQSDSMLRVFMVFKKLEQPIQIESQTFVPFERNGLTVVEWGGGEIQ